MASVTDPSLLPCFELDAISSPEPSSLSAVFSTARPIGLAQPWRSVPEPAFRPGTVRFGWNSGKLLIFAELADDDIYSDASQLNDITWERGDVFEIFLRNLDQQEYLELHVTPNNQKLQLRIPSLEDLRIQARRNAVISSFRVDQEEIFSSWVWVNTKERRWLVLAAVPFRQIGLPPQPLGGELLFSFGRYDHTRGSVGPVLSTSSAHQQIDFHRQHEWGRLKIIKSAGDS